MKNLILVPLVLISLFVKGQEIPKGSNVIKVATQMADDSMFYKAGVLLLDQGYQVDTKDAQFKTFKATMNNPEGSSYSMEINIRIKEGVVIMSGNAFGSSGTYHFTFPLTYRKGEGIALKGFILMDKFAKSLNGTVSYETKK